MKSQHAVARPYARALWELARERNQVEAVGPELQAVAEAVAARPELRTLFGRPWVPAAAQRAVALEVATRLGVSALTRDLVGLAAGQGRADHLEAIAETYRALVDEQQGRVRARVRTAVPLTPDERQALQQRLGRALGSTMGNAPPPGARAAMVVRGEPRSGGEPSGDRAGMITPARGERITEVMLNEVVDEQLLGGFVAEVDSYIVDGSLDGQLARLRDRLAKG